MHTASPDDDQHSSFFALNSVGQVLERKGSHGFCFHHLPVVTGEKNAASTEISASVSS
jgi:hypothetical protein